MQNSSGFWRQWLAATIEEVPEGTALEEGVDCIRTEGLPSGDRPVSQTVGEVQGSEGGA